MNSDGIAAALEKFSPVSLDTLRTEHFMNRTETKYLFNAGKIPQILGYLLHHYTVLEIGRERELPYSTVYFDTPEHSFYNDHVRGKLNRYKIRLRNYEITGTTYLEIKKKTNKGRTVKWRTERELFNDRLDDSSLDFIQNHLINSDGSYESVLINRFKRITLSSVSPEERITIDYELTFAVPGMPEKQLPFLAIAEVKQEADNGSQFFNNIAKNMSIYPRGFSKYCVGSAIVNSALKGNMMKKKLLFLKKLENEYN